MPEVTAENIRGLLGIEEKDKPATFVKSPEDVTPENIRSVLGLKKETRPEDVSSGNIRSLLGIEEEPRVLIPVPGVSLKRFILPEMPEEMTLMKTPLRMTEEMKGEIEESRREWESEMAARITRKPLTYHQQQMQSSMRMLRAMGGAITAPLRGLAVEMHRASLKSQHATEDQLKEVPTFKDMFSYEMVFAPPTASEIELMGLPEWRKEFIEKIRGEMRETLPGRIALGARDLFFEVAVDPITHGELWNAGMRLIGFKQVLKKEANVRAMRNALRKETVWGQGVFDDTVRRIASKDPDAWRQLTGSDAQWRRIFRTASARSTAVARPEMTVSAKQLLANRGFAPEEIAGLTEVVTKQGVTPEVIKTLARRGLSAEQIRRVVRLKQPVSIKEGLARLGKIEQSMKLDEVAKIGQIESAKIRSYELMQNARIEAEARARNLSLSGAELQEQARKLGFKTRKEMQEGVAEGERLIKERLYASPGQLRRRFLTERLYGEPTDAEVSTRIIRGEAPLQQIRPVGKLNTQAQIAERRAREIARKTKEKLKQTATQLRRESRKKFTDGDISDTSAIGAQESSAHDFVLINNHTDDAIVQTNRAADIRKERYNRRRLARHVKDTKITPEEVVEQAARRHEVDGESLRAAENLGILYEGASQSAPAFSRRVFGGGYVGRFMSFIASTERKAQQWASGFELASRFRRYQSLRDISNVRVSKVLKEFRKLIRNKNDEIALIAKIEGREIPVQVKDMERINRAEALWDATRRITRNAALDAGIDVGYIEKYWPRYYSEKMMDSVSWRNEAIQSMLRSGEAATVADANRLLGILRQNQRGRMAAHLELRRATNLPGYINDDFFYVAQQYMRRSNERIYQSRIFGKQDEIYMSLLKQAEAQGGVGFREMLEKWGDLELRKRGLEEILGSSQRRERLFRNVRAVTSGFSLSISTGVLQASQSVFVAASGGIMRTMAQVILRPRQSMRALREIGYVIDDVGHPLLMETSTMFEKRLLGEKVARVMLAPTGIVFMDRLFRGAAAVIGRSKADELFEIMRAGRGRSFEAMKRLRESGVDVTTAMERGGLTEVERNIFARDFSRVANVEANLADLPEWWRGGGIKTMFQFKSFMYGSARGFKRILHDELKIKGPAFFTKSLLTFVVGGEVVGEAINDIRAQIRGKKRTTELGERMLENLSTIGVLSVWEFMRDMAYYGMEPPAAGKARRLAMRIKAGDFHGAFGEVFPTFRPAPKRTK